MQCDMSSVNERVRKSIPITTGSSISHIWTETQHSLNPISDEMFSVAMLVDSNIK